MNRHMWNVAELGPGTVVAGWRVQERLGVGGYGAVYLVESVEHPGTLGALKVFFHPQDIRAGREQALLVDKAIHTNVVRCLGAGRWPHPIQGHPFLVLEYVRGSPLHSWVEDSNPSFTRLTYLGAEVARVLGHLHARGVLHRDLKPEHVLVREVDMRPVLVDFGVGDYEGADTLTETPLPPGTAHLRSPEAACFWLAYGDKPRARYTYRPSDELYALGVCLYRATTGHYPFPSGADVKQLLYMDIAYRVPPPPVEVNPRVPLALSDIIMRLLAKQPEARYRNGEEVHAALLAAVTFGGREPWEASVFEWEEVPSGEAPEGANTATRRIRRPPPPVREQQPDPSPAVPPPAEPPAAEPSGRPRKAMLMLASIAALVALLATTFVFMPREWSRDQEETPQVTARHPPAAVQKVEQPAKPPDTASAPASPPPAEDRPEATVQPVRRKENVSMKKNNPPPPQPEQKPATTEVVPTDAWRQTLLICLLYGGTACTGAQVRPQREDCPPEAIAAMRSLNLDLPGSADIWLDVTKPRSRGMDNYTDGPIISSIAYTKSDIPEGSVLYGQLWVNGNGVDHRGHKRLYGRWDRLKLPDGRELPVCFILGDPDGVEEPEKGPPGYARLPRIAPLMSVKRFVFERDRD